MFNFKAHLLNAKLTNPFPFCKFQPAIRKNPKYPNETSHENPVANLKSDYHTQ